MSGNEAKIHRLTETIKGLTYSLGPLIMEALRDPTVIEIMLNPDGRIWIEHLGRPMQSIGVLSPEQAHLAVSVMATYVKTNATAENPIIEGELPIDGSRFEGIIPPVVSNPIFVIRKKASAVYSLKQYVANGILPNTLIQDVGVSTKGIFNHFYENATMNSLDFISGVIAGRGNVLIVGSTGSGKTTLINAFGQTLSKVATQDRLIIIEDTLEIQIESKNAVFLRTSDFVDFRRLVRACMRLRPDRIIIGEVRDGAALDLLKAWNTGHPGGFASIHANSAYEGLTRLEELVEEATNAPKQRLIAAAIDLVVFIEKAAGSRKVTEIARIKGYNPATKEYELEYWLNRDLVF